MFGSNLRQWEFWRELISFRSLVIVSPVFLLTVKHWINLVVFIVFLGSLYYLNISKRTLIKESDYQKRWRWIFSLTLLGPFLSLITGQILREDFYLANFDSPLRFCLCIPIFIAVSKGWLHDSKKSSICLLWINYFFPLCLLFTILNQNSWTVSWGTNRITTYFVDPLTFGSYTLLFSLLGISNIYINWNKIGLMKKFLISFCILSGIFLSIMSASKTGWLVLPFFCFYLLFYYSMSNKNLSLKFLILLICILIILFLINNFQPFLSQKYLDFAKDLYAYDFNKINDNSSTSMRISFYRIGLYFFFERPFSGWGDTGWLILVNAPEITYYANEYTRNFLVNGFHNEFLTSAIRSGILGFITSLALIIIPFIFSQVNNNINNRFVNFNLTVISFHFFITGLTTELTNLVFQASFIGLIFSVFIGEIIYQEKN